MKQFPTLLFTIVCFMLSTCSNSAAELSDNGDVQMDQPELPFAGELQAALDQGLQQYGGMGLSAAVIVPGYQPWVGVSGVSHGTTLITKETVFDAGSTHKIFTAAVILQLAEEGVLSLDDPLHRWLPDYDHVDNTITIQQLLNHTGGVFDMVRHPFYWEAISADPSKVWTPEEILDNFLLDPYFVKGEGWHYSTPGYILLRLIIEKATGEDLAVEYRKRLWNPLGLVNTYLANYGDLPEDTAHGWIDLDRDGTYEDVYPFVSFNTSTAGAVYSTAEDLAQWSQAFFRDEHVLTQESLAKALEFQTTTPDEPLLSGYGLWVVRFSAALFNDLELWGHSGNAAGYTAGCFYLPDYEASIAILGNTDAGEAMPTINDLFDILIKEMP